MTSNNLLKLLGNRAYLHQVSYQELKSMVVQYPYSQSLRYLLAMKSQQEDNTDLDRNIEMLATYGIDRAHLHQIFSEAPIVLEDLEETIIMGEDYLELKELSSLEREMESNLVTNEISSISFLDEAPIPNANSRELPFEDKALLAKELPILPSNVDEEIEASSLETLEIELPESTSIETATDDSLIEKAVTVSAIIGGTTLLGQNTEENELAVSAPIIDTPIKTEKPVVETVPVEEEEDFITMDFEVDSLDKIGIAIPIDDLAPSASISVQKIAIKEDGLPPDAVEVNDFHSDAEKEKEGQISDLFKEAEAEVLAEEAISDSKIFINNPEELLEAESKKVFPPLEPLSNETIPELATSEAEVTEELPETTAKPDQAKRQIPFEISYSEKDPFTSESMVASELEDDVIPTMEDNNPEADGNNPEVEAQKEVLDITSEAILPPILPQTKSPQVPIENFKFDSLDQFEASLKEKQLTPSTAPVPKSGFSSWQAQASGISTLSGINLLPLDNKPGKVVIRKKKVIRKQFEKTVAFAEESLTMTEGIVSETLAQLLVKQGQYSQARVMYDKLCLIMPEKSSFFAGEIEKIQNLPDEPS